ncbi:hypothetical protein PMG11_00340 [Penicillium brasilianum]|uniref:J domain-containing protein n=1 Tax=Penicillium brasilianum TaxID=104259 RepID=A0A0F7TDY5_PENBI|nr:hypothetical protein PMG11_00340 [Penicillium brasilianum]
MSTMMFVDHYAVLGVKRNASSKEINIAWKQFALKYHPDKCNGNKAIEEFLKGLEAAETLRDPQRREHYDKELKAHDSRYRTGWAGRKHHPPRTSPAHSSPLNPQSHYSGDPGDRTDPQRSWNQTGNRNDYHGPTPKYSEAQMDMIFETVKRRERERIAAEKQKVRQAEAEVKQNQRETDQEMHAWETDNCLSGDLGAQKAQAQRHEGCNWRDSTLDSPTDWDDSSSDSDGGMPL